MKKNLLYFTVLIVITSASLSCKKDNLTVPIVQIINENIKINQSYQFDLGNFGDEEGASISKQANHFLISTTNMDLNTGKIIYIYTPTTNFVGKDEVQLKSSRGSDGSSANNKIILTTIKFTITN